MIANNDLVLGIATPAAQTLANLSTDVPVLFTAVTDPVSAKLVDSMENPGGIVHEYYNFVANTFYYDYASGLMTDEANYSKSGSAPAAAATTPAATTPAVTETPAPTTATATTANNNTSNANVNSNDYDNVPKTGESNLVVWLLGLSALSFVGCLAFLRREAVRK